VTFTCLVQLCVLLFLLLLLLLLLLFSGIGAKASHEVGLRC